MISSHEPADIPLSNHQARAIAVGHGTIVLPDEPADILLSADRACRAIAVGHRALIPSYKPAEIPQSADRACGIAVGHMTAVIAREDSNNKAGSNHIGVNDAQIRHPATIVGRTDKTEIILANNRQVTDCETIAIEHATEGRALEVIPELTGIRCNHCPIKYLPPRQIWSQIDVVDQYETLIQ